MGNSGIMTQEELIAFRKARSAVYNAAHLKECIFHGIEGAICENIIKAHSLQRMGVLSRLAADVNGRKGVYTPLEIDPIDNRFWFAPVGKKDASTFFGMCQRHDLACFKDIENDTDSINIKNDDHLFALSLRAFAVSYHAKKEDVKLYSTEDTSVIDAHKIFAGDDNLKGRLEMADISLAEQAAEIATFNHALETKDYTKFDVFAYEFPHEIPFAASMACNPPFLFSGKAINISTDPKDQYSSIYSTALPLNGRSIVVLGALKSDPYGSAYLDEVSSFSDGQMPSVLSWHFLTNLENLAFSPIWANGLVKTDQEKLINTIANFKSSYTPYEKYKLGKLRINIFEDYKARKK